MTPRFKETLQTIGALLVTFCLGMYVWQGVPFLMTDPTSPDIASGQARVIEKSADSLSGATHETAVTYRLRFASDKGIEGLGEVSHDFFNAVSVEDPVEVVFWGKRCLLTDDVRWQPELHRRYWFMLTATAAFGFVALRRVLKRGKP